MRLESETGGELAQKPGVGPGSETRVRLTQKPARLVSETASPQTQKLVVDSETGRALSRKPDKLDSKTVGSVDSETGGRFDSETGAA